MRHVDYIGLCLSKFIPLTQCNISFNNFLGRDFCEVIFLHVFLKSFHSLFFYKTTLLKYNSHAIKYIHLKYIIKCFLVRLQSCATFAIIFIQNISSQQKRNLIPISITPYSSFHPTLISMKLPILDISYENNYTACSLLCLVSSGEQSF